MRAHATLAPALLSGLLCALAVCDRQQSPPPPVNAPAASSVPHAATVAGQATSPQPSPAIQETVSPAATAQPPPVLSRQEWQAKEPAAGMKPHRPSRITIHHTAETQRADLSLERKMQSLQSFSQQPAKLAGGGAKPAWPDVPYHFYVDLRGRIAEGRDISYAGDTNTDYDPTGHILIVLEGNFEKEQPTAAQLQQLTGLLRWLCGRWQIPATEIKGHGDYAATACPGRNLKVELPRLREGAASKGDER